MHILNANPKAQSNRHKNHQKKKSFFIHTIQVSYHNHQQQQQQTLLYTFCLHLKGDKKAGMKKSDTTLESGLSAMKLLSLECLNIFFTISNDNSSCVFDDYCEIVYKRRH